MYSLIPILCIYLCKIDYYTSISKHNLHTDYISVYKCTLIITNTLKCCITWEAFVMKCTNKKRADIRSFNPVILTFNLCLLFSYLYIKVCDKKATYRQFIITSTIRAI